MMTNNKQADDVAGSWMVRSDTTNKTELRRIAYY
jgi:hypothetical protein